MILFKLFLLFFVLFLSGFFLTLALFKFNLRKLRDSELSKKILLWIPIFFIFIFIVFSSSIVQLIGLSILVFIALYEFLRVIIKTSKDKIFLTIYIIFFLFALLHLLFLSLLNLDITNLLIVIGFASATSDVTAFFCGKFFGAHKLPSFINVNKTWEGALGQIAGALIGVFLVKLFIVDKVSLLLFLPIGVGSAVGDMLNSYIKRKVNIKRWSNFISGHGGFIDRFSSLAWSAVLTFYFILLF